MLSDDSSCCTENCNYQNIAGIFRGDTDQIAFKSEVSLGSAFFNSYRKQGTSSER